MLVAALHQMGDAQVRYKVELHKQEEHFSIKDLLWRPEMCTWKPEEIIKFYLEYMHIGLENWLLRKVETSNLEAFVMWYRRRSLKSSWTE